MGAITSKGNINKGGTPGINSRSARGLLTIFSFWWKISAFRSEPREFVPLLFHKGFFAFECTHVMERGETDLSRIKEALGRN